MKIQTLEYMLPIELMKFVITNIEDWHYIQSKSNVADDATHWRSFSDLNSNSRWLNGP